MLSFEFLTYLTAAAVISAAQLPAARSFKSSAKQCVCRLQETSHVLLILKTRTDKFKFDQQDF
ncbi:MAG: hypothetical protein A3I66_13580 [Burkholderiales bacterium RIFCSPLOWO2_02_FULL_57_36]|nr:MAG: hypothetical protein A3I66_13580 [Burkholderiales bacterium RIFCSPLOWO2_02_FULL_57_36]